MLRNVAAEWEALLLRIQVSGSNLGPETRYPNWGFYSFPQFLQADAGIVP
jgi:hypothetical protein